MKKIFLYLFAGLGMMSAQAQTYTDITPNKFKFNTYTAGTLADFWNAKETVNHGTAGTNVITLAQAANFGNAGYAYFYFNQSTNPDKYTSIVNVEGVGNVLQFGDAGMGAGFGGCYFVPQCTQNSNPMRMTIVYRVIDGVNSSNTDASISVGTRDTGGNGPDLASVTYSNSKVGWHKAVVEYKTMYAIRFNFSQMIWGDLLQIAEIKFEEMTDVPSGHTYTSSNDPSIHYFPRNHAGQVGNFYTICLPFDGKADNADVYEVTGKDKKDDPTALYIEQKATNTIDAGVAYLYKPTAENVTFTFTSYPNPAVSPETGNPLVGSFVAGTFIEAGKHYLKNNTWYTAKASTTKIKQYGAYLDITKVSEKVKSGIVMRLGDETTGIEGVGADGNENVEMFDMLGRPVDPQTHKGFAIVGGKKVFVK